MRRGYTSNRKGNSARIRKLADAIRDVLASYERGMIRVPLATVTAQLAIHHPTPSEMALAVKEPISGWQFDGTQFIRRQ